MTGMYNPNYGGIFDGLINDSGKIDSNGFIDSFLRGANKKIDGFVDKVYQPAPLAVIKLSDTATVPTKAHEHDAGFDLYADEDSVLCNGPNLVSTSIAMEIPEGYVGLIWPRSGLSAKHGIDVLAGVIDSGYRGEIKVCLQIAYREDGSPFYVVERGDKIAQILIQEVPRFKLVEAETLSDSNRGEEGFGSSDTKPKRTI